jgi:hypothetical protein
LRETIPYRPVIRMTMSNPSQLSCTPSRIVTTHFHRSIVRAPSDN